VRIVDYCERHSNDPTRRNIPIFRDTKVAAFDLRDRIDLSEARTVDTLDPRLRRSRGDKGHQR